MGRSPVKVGQLNQYISRILRTDPILADVSVVGEISNLKFHSSGHVYFSLKDDFARVGCFLAAPNLEHIKGPLEEGIEVIATGYISVYERGGNYSLNVQDIETGGVGQLAARFEELRKKLSEEGLFDREHKKELPFFPEKIAIVTSPTGAAVQDVMKIIRSRNDYVDILVYPVLVQGPSAPGEIAEAIDDLNVNYKNIDIIITGRGGGSAEELWAFNEEPVLRSIFRSKIPVISAVGHETDVTLSDFVADVRAETPTAAAQMAVPDTGALREHLDELKEDLISDLEYRLDQFTTRLRSLDPVAFASGLKTRMNYEQVHLDDLMEQMKYDLDSRMDRIRSDMGTYKEILETASPFRILGQGYSYVTGEDGRILRSVDEVSPGDPISIRMSDGSADAEIKSTNKEVNHGD